MHPVHYQQEALNCALRVRCGWLLLAHLPALLLWGLGAGWSALCLLLAVHGLLLWGTLNPQSQMFGPLLRRLNARDLSVWLTIDDGPSTDTLALLQLLDRYQTKATFFLVAERAQQHPQLVRAIVQAGHEVANHSNSHPQARFWCLSPQQMASEIVQAQQTLTELAGQPPRYFRAVVGHANPFVQPILRVLGLQRVAWSVRGFDAVQGDVEQVVSKLSKALHPGAIVLLHEGAAHGNNVAIIERLLSDMQSRGYHAVLPT